MTTYANAGDNENILSDTTGGTALTVSDIVNILQGGVAYSQTLEALGSTAFAEFNTGPGFNGQLGDYPAGLLVQAGIIRLADSGRRHAIKCDGAHVVDELEWKNRVGGMLTLEGMAELTLAKLLSPGTVAVKSTAKVVTVHVASPGLTATFLENIASPVDPITLLQVGTGGAQGLAKAIINRRATTITVEAGGEAIAREACAPTTVNNSGGIYTHQSTGAIGTINAGAGSRFDFSAAVGDSSSVTWNITGDITIVEPPEGVSIDMPTAAEKSGFRVRFEEAA